MRARAVGARRPSEAGIAVAVACAVVTPNAGAALRAVCWARSRGVASAHAVDVDGEIARGACPTGRAHALAIGARAMGRAAIGAVSNVFSPNGAHDDEPQHHPDPHDRHAAAALAVQHNAARACAYAKFPMEKRPRSREFQFRSISARRTTTGPMETHAWRAQKLLSQTPNKFFNIEGRSTKVTHHGSREVDVGQSSNMGSRGPTKQSFNRAILHSNGFRVGAFGCP